MAAELPKLDFLRATLNSVTHFQTEYWHYADPVKSVARWAGFRDRAEELLAKLESDEEYLAGAELMKQADQYILSPAGRARLRAQDFKGLERSSIPKERWWWWFDLVLEGKLHPEPGPITHRPLTSGTASSA
ncbi:MAG: hypothetical protein V2G42_05570 [bacterium JZ-2024 1]